MKKKLLSILLIMSMVMSFSVPAIQAKEAYDINDALEILKYLAGLTVEIDFAMYDIDNDGSITINDALEILKGLAGLITPAVPPNAATQAEVTETSANDIDITTTQASPDVTASEDPTGTGQEPTGTGQDPTGTAQDPAGTAQDPTGTAQDPTGTTQEPTGTGQEPTGTGQEPTGTGQEPTGTGQEPTGTGQEPTGTTPEPTGTTPEPTGTTPEPTGTAPEPTGTTPEPTGTAPEPTSANVETNVLYDMQTDDNLLGILSSSDRPEGVSSHWLFVGAGGTRTVDVSARIVTISNRSNPGAGLDIRAAVLDIRAGYSYTFEITGTLGNTAGVEARFSLFADGNNVETLIPNSVTGANGAFEMSYTVTHGQITQHIQAHGSPHYRIRSDASLDNIVITGIRIIEFLTPGGEPQPTGTTTPTGTEPPPPDGTPNVIYNMQNDRELHLFSGGGGEGGVSIHELLGSNGGRRIADVLATPKTITLLERGGTSQGIDINLSALNTRANHSYQFEFTGSVITGTGQQSVWLRTVADSPATFDEARVAINEVFTLTHTASHDTISRHITDGIQRYRFGGASQQEIVITGLVITALCPASCVGCAPPPLPVIPSGSFNSISAEQLVQSMTIGWNLGNTLDSYNSSSPGDALVRDIDLYNPTAIETRWLGERENRTTQGLIREVKNAGFNSIRIPVTWYKAAGPAPTHTIDPRWMAHVQWVVDLAVAEDMYIILNTHHENYMVRLSTVAERTDSTQFVTAIWSQIATHFRDYDEKLIFEGLNEPRARRSDWYNSGDDESDWDWTGNAFERETVNLLNQSFVNAVRNTGGNNQFRCLMLPTYGAQARDTQLADFRLPTDPTPGNSNSKFIMSVHIYSPHDWAHSPRGSVTYASAGGVGRIQTDLGRVADRAAQLGVPAILGEWGTRADSPQISQNDRVIHAYDYVKTATDFEYRSSNPAVLRTFVWDTNRGYNLVNRQTPHIDSNARAIIDAMLAGFERRARP
jgi:endoglucanase